MIRQARALRLVATFAISLALAGTACSSKATSEARTPPTAPAAGETPTTALTGDTSTTVAAPTTESTATTTTTPTPTTIACRTVTDPPPPNIKLGDCGPMVESIQSQLTVAGFPVTVSGVFDATTDQAVKDFQAANALEVDGLVGSITFLTLFGSLGD
ncbi:MAG: peptidoglycan-binding protein [Actinobacteria bacterium]|nr:peptidoglycan-binding protein [Actinomycetota bacterium]